MTGDAAAADLLAQARSLIARLQGQEERFLQGRPSTTAPGPRARGRKKKGRDAKRTNRPTWPCGPLCTRRRSDHSLKHVPGHRRKGHGFVAPTGDSDVDEVDDDAEEHPRALATPSATGAVEAAPSSVSVNTFVAIQVQDIMEKAAHNMASLAGARAAGDTADAADAARVKALRHQVMRAATYTAVCRRLEHALLLYSETAPYRAPRRRSLLEAMESELPEVRPLATIADLPKSALLAIFSFLEQRDLSLRVAPVCRLWHQLAYHRALWRHLLLDWSAEGDAGRSRLAPTCAFLASTPGLLKLELVGCCNVDQLLWQVVRSCRRLRILAVDSCTVSDHLRRDHDEPECVMSEILTKCKKLHSLIVAFTPLLTQSAFFTTLGRRCWSMRCFLVSADVSDTRTFFSSASQHAPGAASRDVVGSARAAILPSPISSRHRVTAIQTEATAAPGPAPGPAPSALLQWRLGRDHADATYFGVNVRVGLALVDPQ